MPDDAPPDNMAERSLEIYREVISKLNLSAKATELVNATEALYVRIESLRENVVSSIVMPANSIYTRADIRYREAVRQSEIRYHPGESSPSFERRTRDPAIRGVQLVDLFIALCSYYQNREEQVEEYNEVISRLENTRKTGTSELFNIHPGSHFFHQRTRFSDSSKLATKKRLNTEHPLIVIW